MSTAPLAAPAAVLGGVLWVAFAVVGGGSGPVADALWYAGLACLLGAAAVFGAGLVRSDATAMRVVVGLASGLLLLSLVEAFRPADTPWYHGTWGAVLALIGAVGLLRRRRREGQTPASHPHAR